MTQAEKAIQGNADGLCGLYALINFLVLQEEVAGDPVSKTKPRQEAMRYLAESAERLGLLTANRIYNGYEWPDIIAIFNEYASRNFFEFIAVPLRHVHRNLEKITNASIFNCILDQGGAAVALVEGGGHWVLVHDRDKNGAFVVIDPSYGEARTEMKRSSSLSEGVALLPLHSDLLKIVTSKAEP